MVRIRFSGFGYDVSQDILCLWTYRASRDVYEAELQHGHGPDILCLWTFRASRDVYEAELQHGHGPYI